MRKSTAILTNIKNISAGIAGLGFVVSVMYLIIALFGKIDLSVSLITFGVVIVALIVSVATDIAVDTRNGY